MSMIKIGDLVRHVYDVERGIEWCLGVVVELRDEPGSSKHCKVFWAAAGTNLFPWYKKDSLVKVL